MKVNYKGFEIDVRREKCLGGWDMLYFDIFRISDGYQLVGDFEDSNETVREKVKQCKEIVDDYLENPSDYEDKDPVLLVEAKIIMKFPCYSCENKGDDAPRCRNFRNCEDWKAWAKENNIPFEDQEATNDAK